jgi:TPR repeat protein
MSWLIGHNHMLQSRIPVQEPFDVALPEFYGTNPRWRIYKRLVEIGVEIGDPLAQYAMATWYLHGHSRIGTRKDLKKAVALLDQCAPFLNRAAYDLAVCKLRGAGTRKDLKAAFSLFSRSASLGSLAAIEAQADCFESGIGTKRDPQAAKLLFQRARRWKRQLEQLGALLPPEVLHMDEPRLRRSARFAKRPSKRLKRRRRKK